MEEEDEKEYRLRTIKEWIKNYVKPKREIDLKSIVCPKCNKKSFKVVTPEITMNDLILLECKTKGCKERCYK
jgi:hypothetical protein